MISSLPPELRASSLAKKEWATQDSELETQCFATTKILLSTFRRSSSRLSEESCPRCCIFSKNRFLNASAVHLLQSRSGNQGVLYTIGNAYMTEIPRNTPPALQEWKALTQEARLVKGFIEVLNHL